MQELFNRDLQKAAADNLDSLTALNYFSLIAGVGAVLVFVIYGLRVVELIRTVFGF